MKSVLRASDVKHAMEALGANEPNLLRGHCEHLVPSVYSPQRARERHPGFIAKQHAQENAQNQTGFDFFEKGYVRRKTIRV